MLWQFVRCYVMAVDWPTLTIWNLILYPVSVSPKVELLRYTEISVPDYHARLVAHSGIDKHHNFHERVECLTPNTAEQVSTRTHIPRRIRRSWSLWYSLCRSCTSFLTGDGQGRSKTSVPRKCPLVLQVKVT
jgi:hypothetical protein